MSFWNEERVARLKELAGQGLSSGQIASLLGREFGCGVSRNAVIGKLMRGKGRYGKLQLPARAYVRAGGAGAATPPPTAPVQPVRARRAAARPSPAPSRSRAEALGLTPLPLKGGEERVSVPAVLPIGFFEAVETGRCLHFIGDPFAPDGPDMPVCGAERAEGALPLNRYCRRHRASQYQARAVA